VEPSSSSLFRPRPALRALSLTLLLAATSAFAQDPREIVRISVERDASNFARFKDYTFKNLYVEKRLDKQGKVTNTETELNEVLILGGRPYERLLERDGKPISEKDAKKEQEKLDKEAAKRAKETDRDRAKLEKDRQEERRFAREIPDAFNFKLLGEELRDGLPVWRIQAEPKPGYRPKDRRADLLKKVRGTLWIDKAGYQWVGAEINVIDTISWGWFVLRIPAGAKIDFEQTRVNDEVWLPKNVHIRADAKVGLLKTFRMDVSIAYSDYRKFRTESKIVGTEEIQ
jgi:hypothetical protein